MKITNYSEQKHNTEKMNIYVDGEYRFSMSKDSFLSNRLYKNLEITEEQIEKWVHEDAPKLAYIQIINTLSYGMKTEKELYDKLKEKGYSDEAMDEAVERAKKYGYINDNYYIECYIKTKAIPAKWGEQKIISKLYQKGIKIEIIKQKLEDLYDENDKYDNAMELAKKKYAMLKDTDKNKKKQKLNSFLLGKGYRYDVISSVIKKIFEDDKDDDY